MQALITTHSKSKHYDPADPEADLVGAPDADLEGDNIGRDVIGLVQAICVKVLFFALSAVNIWLLKFRLVHLQNGSSISQTFKCAAKLSPFASC